MYTIHDFAERYKMISNSELLEILQNPGQYQAIALSAAKSEFASRNLSDAEINEAKQVLLDKKNKKDKQNEIQDGIKTKLVDAGNMIYDTMDPAQIRISTALKIIRITSLVFACLVIYKVSVDFDLLLAIIKGDSGLSFGYTVFFFPIMVGLTAALLFWLKKRAGWLLLAFFCSYSMVDVLYGLYHSITFQFSRESSNYLFPAPSPGAFILATVFYVGTILAICRQDVREVYKIEKQQIQGPLILGGLLGIALFMLLTY